MELSSFTLLAQDVASQSSDNPWVSLLAGFDSDHRFVLLIVLLLSVVGVLITAISVAAHTIGTIQRRNCEARLKQDMLDRGMTAEEIATVVESTPPTDFLERWAKK